MDRLSLLVKARTTADYITNHKFVYSQDVEATWDRAKEKKKCNCSAYVCYCLQQLGILKKGQLLYGNRSSGITYRGAGTKRQIKKYYKIIKVGKTPAEYKDKMKPGDICLYRLHTNIFAGINKKGEMIWWDAGKKATNTGKDGGTYKNIHRKINGGQKITYILRYKE